LGVTNGSAASSRSEPGADGIRNIASSLSASGSNSPSRRVRAASAFLMHSAPGLLKSHARQGTTHAALLAQILDLLARNRRAPLPAWPRPPLEPLSNSELRVRRYLPTYLSSPQIATQLSVSTSTVKTHLRNLYAKLGVHSRIPAVESACALGLLAPCAHQR
jgi:LuxR family transcriptional regulator, maltose regulon positive regulatory protein